MRGAQGAYKFLRNLESTIGRRLKVHIVHSATVGPEHALVVVNRKGVKDLLQQSFTDRMYTRLSQLNVLAGTLELGTKAMKKVGVIEDDEVSRHLYEAMNQKIDDMKVLQDKKLDEFQELQNQKLDEQNQKLNNIEALLQQLLSQEPMGKKPIAGAGGAPKQGNGGENGSQDGAANPEDGASSVKPENGGNGGEDGGNGVEDGGVDWKDLF